MLQNMLASIKITLFARNVAIACFAYLLFFSLANATDSNGVTVDMLHRIPSANNNGTRSHWHDAYHHSLARFHRFRKIKSPSRKSYDSFVTSGIGGYYMKLSFGSPPVEVLALVDSGSDLTWIQCKPCVSCYKQDFPLFDPTKSSTYQKLPCNSKYCSEREAGSWCSNSTCHYQYGYFDDTLTQGELALDTITIGSNPRRQASFRNVVIGCGLFNKGDFDSKGAGIVGLGSGPFSLISQLASTFQKRFSYCLAPPLSTSATSKIRFGEHAVVSGPGKVSIPLVHRSPHTFYSVTLLGITVGEPKKDAHFIRKYNRLHSSSANGTHTPTTIHPGNMVVDSGTQFTFIPKDLYKRFKMRLIRSIKAKPVRVPSDVADVCYKARELVDPPFITLHFAGGDLKLDPLNSFIDLNGRQDILCLSMMQSPPKEENEGILGSMAQINFEVGYDLNEKIVSFVPTSDCTKY